MKISKLLWEYNKDRPQGEIDMEAIQGRAIGKTTAYCLRLIVEAMERPEQRVEIKNEPYTIDNYHTQRNVEIQVGKLIEDMKLDWMDGWYKQIYDE